MRRRLIFDESTTPEDLARVARLRYVSDQDPGISRRRNGAGFAYAGAAGRPLRDPRKINRIETLAIPPAWRDVWICRDARKRKQYLYHPRWQEIANLAKFTRLAEFGAVLPQLRATVSRDLNRRGLTRQRVLAGMVALLDETGIRVGNEEYVKENGSYGLTTLRNRHVTAGQKSIELRFRAKGGFRREVTIENARLARLIRECGKLSGSRVFQYLDEQGRPRALNAIDVNEYIQETTGHAFTAKDFRTWKASARAAGKLFAADEIETLGSRRKYLREVVCDAASLLSNTPTVCRNYYIHPGLVDSFEGGDFRGYFASFAPRKKPGLTRDEQILSRFLRQWRPVVAA
jgi:DNA topoisomerase-1